MQECDLRIIIIAAASQNNVIGKGIDIPWHSDEELNHFKKTTIGFPIIMGRTTWESLNLPLHERINIVLTRRKNYPINLNAMVFNSLQESLEYCERVAFEKCFIIGGAEVYRQAINIANEIIISIMKFNADGNVFFPVIDMNIWEECNKEDFEEFTIHTYIRKEKSNEKVSVAKNQNITGKSC